MNMRCDPLVVAGAIILAVLVWNSLAQLRVERELRALEAIHLPPTAHAVRAFGGGTTP